MSQPYKCTRCGATRVVLGGESTELNQNNLIVKKTVFMNMGAGAKTIKSRVVDWLCPKCVIEDPEWQRPPFVAPGNTRVASGQ